jgi:hypothetical protein
MVLNGMVKTMDILAVDAHSRMELCTPTWLNYDYGDGRVVDILALDAYSVVDVCTPIFLGEASKMQIIVEKTGKLKWMHPLTKLNTNKGCYVNNIWL